MCGPVLLPACPPLPHVTILSTSSSSMACIIRHRRRHGAPQKEAGAHTKTFAFLHLIRVVIARQRKRLAPCYLVSFYRWRLKCASKCQLLTAEKRSWPSRSHLSLSPSAHLQLTLPPVHPLLRASDIMWHLSAHMSAVNIVVILTLPVSSSVKQQLYWRGWVLKLPQNTKLPLY